MHSKPRFTEHFDLDLSNSTQGDIIQAPQAVNSSRMEPTSREAVYNASFRPMTIIAGETVIAGEPVMPPDDVVKHGKGKGRDGDHKPKGVQAGSAYPNPYFDQPLSPLEGRSSPLETINGLPVATKTADPKRQTLLDELSRFSFDSNRSSFDWDDAQSPTTVNTSVLFPGDDHATTVGPNGKEATVEDEDDDLDITAELQADSNNQGESRCRVNSYEEVLLRCKQLGDEADAAKATSAPTIAGPSRAHIPRARETGAGPIKPVQDIEMGIMGITRNISGTTLTPSVAKPRGCWQAFVHTIDGMSRAYEEEYFPKTDGPSQQWGAFGERVAPGRIVDEVSKAFAGADYRAENDDFSRKWRSACWKISQGLDMINEAVVNAVVPKRYQPDALEMVEVLRGRLN